MCYSSLNLNPLEVCSDFVLVMISSAFLPLCTALAPETDNSKNVQRCQDPAGSLDSVFFRAESGMKVTHKGVFWCRCSTLCV